MSILAFKMYFCTVCQNNFRVKGGAPEHGVDKSGPLLLVTITNL